MSTITVPAPLPAQTSPTPFEQLAAAVVSQADQNRPLISAWHRPVGLLAPLATVGMVVGSPWLLPWVLIGAAALITLKILVTALAATQPALRRLQPLRAVDLGSRRRPVEVSSATESVRPIEGSLLCSA